MSENSERLREISDAVAKEFFGRTVSEAHNGCVCVTCGKLAIEFNDDRSRSEYSISGLCEDCQDKVFGVQ